MENVNEIEIEIGYTGFITLGELNLIVKEIESAIDLHLRKQAKIRSRRQVDNRYVQIKSLREGSVIIKGLLLFGGFAAGIVSGGVKKGIEKSKLGKRLNKIGEKMGDKTDALLEKIGASMTTVIKKLRFGKRKITKIDVSINGKRPSTINKEIPAEEIKPVKTVKPVKKAIARKKKKK